MPKRYIGGHKRLKNLFHSTNIVRYIEHFEEQWLTIPVCTEYADGGDLAAAIHNASCRRGGTADE